MTEATWAFARRIAIVVAIAATTFALFAGFFIAVGLGRNASPTAPVSAAGEAVQVPRAPVAPEPPRPALAPDPSRPVVAPERVRIPTIGVDAPLIPLGLNPDRSLAVPKQAKIAGWYTGAPIPGGVGPAIVVGHIDLDGAPGVFKRLDELRPGDEVEFRSREGVTATFVVTHWERVAKDAFPTQRVYGNTAGPELRLITCGGVFDRSTGHYRDNVIVYAKAVRG